MSKDPYEGLRMQLEDRDWPAVFLFKFIVPADNQKVAEVEALFDTKVAQIELRPSKTGKFISISAKEMMIDVDSIIDRYKKATKIEGLMAL
jgi:putative lipoic acid-binding regulatory protein